MRHHERRVLKLCLLWVRLPLICFSAAGIGAAEDRWAEMLPPRRLLRPKSEDMYAEQSAQQADLADPPTRLTRL